MKNKNNKNLTTKIFAGLALFAILASIVSGMILYFVGLNNAQVQVEENPNEMTQEELLDLYKKNIKVESSEFSNLEKENQITEGNAPEKNPNQEEAKLESDTTQDVQVSEDASVPVS